MSNNIFSSSRFSMLVKQHLTHNNKLLLYAVVAFCGVAFIVLTLTQLGNNLEPHRIELFRGFLMGFVGVFGVLYVGYSFPAFRSKESTISYLTIPASTFEKFLFELISRIGIIFLLLPLLFWITFHLQGYFFGMFSDYKFEPIMFSDLGISEITKIDEWKLIIALISSGTLLAFSLPFAGAAMFSKQPLVKTLFSVAIIVICYALITYLFAEPLGLSKWRPPEDSYIIPNNEVSGLKLFTTLNICASLIMLLVAYLKLKEKEV